MKRGRLKDFSVHNSTNARFRTIQYGLRRLDKVEKQLEKKLKAKAQRYNKHYPGEMVHFDTKRLPLLTGESRLQKSEYLFVAIDDYSRELYVSIQPDKTQESAARFLKQVLEECPYTVEVVYSDNGLEYKGSVDKHEFMKLCKEQGIEQRFTRPYTSKTNGKAERVIKTLMEMWHKKTKFNSKAHRKTELVRFTNYYNTVKPHSSLNNQTPLETLINYFYPQEL